MKRALLLVILLLVFVSGCTSEKSAQVQSVETIKYVYTILDEKDVSTGYAVRKIVRIVLPKGLDRKVVEENVTAVARETEKKYAQKDKGLAIDVYAFTDDDIVKKGESTSLFVEGTYAHDGEWTNSNQKYSPSAMKTKISIKDSYFNK